MLVEGDGGEEEEEEEEEDKEEDKELKEGFKEWYLILEGNEGKAETIWCVSDCGRG